MTLPTGLTLTGSATPPGALALVPFVSVANMMLW